MVSELAYLLLGVDLEFSMPLLYLRFDCYHL